MSNAWFKDAIIYQIFIDRFAGFKDTKNWDTPQFIGGNLRGIIGKIPYLKELGINTIWLSPFCRTSAYHGYHVTDFFDVDSHFGSIKDLRELIRTAHENNIRIIADFVPNHCSRQHPYFLDAQNNRQSKFHDWFIFRKWPDDYMCFLSVKDIPKINLEFRPAREHIISSALFWLGIGIDGFRLDHVLGPTHDFWKEFKRRIKEKYPSAALIGEAWIWGIRFKELETINIRDKYFKWLKGPGNDSVLKEYEEELDGVLDFSFQDMAVRFIAKDNSANAKKKFISSLEMHYQNFKKGYFLCSFLDNHDMDRFLFKCGGDKKKLMDAASVQFSSAGPAVIYYGTEIGMSQKCSIFDFSHDGDLQARMPMDWETQDRDLFCFYKSLIKKKKITKPD